MSIFENLEEIFQDWRGYNECAKSLVTLATAIGTIVFVFYTIKFLWNAIIAIRLYICSQICCRVDYMKKYGKWAVVSGSTDGIGLALAKELAKRGHSILVIGRNDEKLANTKEALEKIENVGDVETVKIDLSDSSVENFNRIRARIDPDNRDIGILINNAGTFMKTFGRFDSTSIEDLVYVVNLNILASVHLTRMILPGMIERERGLLVNVSSSMGNATIPFTRLYAPTKVFMNDFTRSLQMEYADQPIDIVCLTPGPVYTKLFVQTESLRGPTFFAPVADDYAQSAINCFGSGVQKMSGTAMHGFISLQSKLIDCLGLTVMSMKLGSYFYPKTIQISPHVNGKRQSNDKSTHPGEQESVLNPAVES